MDLTKIATASSTKRAIRKRHSRVGNSWARTRSLVTRAAVTEPFTDFSVEAIVALGVKRTYTSADATLRGKPVRIFGRG